MRTADKLTLCPALRVLAAAIAAQWIAPALGAVDVVPQISLLADSNDNPRLRPEQENEAQRTLVDARVTLTNVGQRGNIFVEPRVRVSAYADEDDEDLENNDWWIRTYGEYDWQTVSSGFYAEFQRRGIQTSEFVSAAPEDPDLPAPPDVGTGALVLFQQEQDTSWFSPFLDYNLSDRSTLRFEYQSTDVSYSGPQFRARSDFNDQRVYAGIVRHVDERTDVSARFFGGNYEGTVNQNQTDSVGVEGRFTRPINEIWSFSLGAGVQRSDFSFYDDNDVFVDNATSNVIADVEFRQRSELRTLNIRVAQEIYPSGSGFLSEVAQLTLYVDQRFSPRVTGRFGVRYDDIATLDEVRTVNDRDYGRVEIEFRWQMARRLSLVGGYQFTAQAFDESPEADADANSIYFGVMYRGLERAP
jgi:hypothetical protein